MQIGRLGRAAAPPVLPATALFAAAVIAAVDAGAQNGDYLYADCHIHLLNFLQGGEFHNDDGALPGSETGELSHQRYATLPAGERWRRIVHVLEEMDRGRIERAIVCGLPVAKKWSVNEPYLRPDGPLDDDANVSLARDTDFAIAAAVHELQQRAEGDAQRLQRLNRVAPFLCGIDPTDLGSVDTVVARIKEFPGVWQGVGEIFLRHDDVTALSLGERPRANHPAVKRIARFAGNHHLPVLIHHNLAPMSRPGSTRPPWYLDELVELFNYCRGDAAEGRTATIFIWAHAGISRRVYVDHVPYWIDQVLAAHGDHVYIDLSWLVLDNYILEDPEAWTQLVERYPERFMLGSDVVGGASRSAQALHEYDEWLETLTPRTRELVARGNLVALLDDMAAKRRSAKLVEPSTADAPPNAGIVLPADYEFPEYAEMPRPGDEASFVRSRLDAAK